MLAAVPAVHPFDIAGLRRCLTGLWLSGLRLEECQDLWWGDSGDLFVDLSGEHPRMRIWAEGQKSGEDTVLPLTPDFGEFLLRTPESARLGQGVPGQKQVPGTLPVREAARGRNQRRWRAGERASQSADGEVRIGPGLAAGPSAPAGRPG